jgi:hypothetical protein
MEKKFDRVVLERELRSDSDGMPTFRKCFDHETLMSFFDDSGNMAFNEWWNAEGSILFNEWLKKSERYKDEAII